MTKVACIIPAKNEAARLAAVLSALQQCDWFLDHIVVVVNGSTDGTEYVAHQFGAGFFECRYTVLVLPEADKYRAMAAGRAVVDIDLLLFLDADLRYLRPEHIVRLLEPVQRGQAAMSCAILERPPPIRWFLVRHWASFTGQRAMLCQVWDALPHHRLSGYEAEAALNSICRLNDWPIERIWWRGVKQFGKRSKMVVSRAFIEYVRTYVPAFRVLIQSRRRHWAFASDERSH